MTDKIKLPTGIQIIIGFHFLSILLWIVGQGGAVVSYDTVAAWGLQEPRAFLDPVIVEVNRAIGLTDIILQIPLFIIGIIGLRRLKTYGAVASWMVLAITLYWPLMTWSAHYFFENAGVTYYSFDFFTNAIMGVIFVFAGWASYYLYRNRNLFT